MTKIKFTLLMTCVAIALPWEPLPLTAKPFVSGSEPGWGKHMSRAQRRALGFEDVPTAAAKPATPANGVPGYAFKLLTIHHDHSHRGIVSGDPSTSTGTTLNLSINSNNNNNSGGTSAPPPAPSFSISQIISEPFGVFATLQECDAARAVKIAELDAKALRIMHQANPTGINGTTGVGPSERQDVTYCEPGIYAPGTMSPGIVKNPDPLPPPMIPIAARVPLEPIELVVPPGFVRQWTAPRPFARVIPGTTEVIEILSASSQQLVFTVKPNIALPPKTNILLVDDNGEVVADLRISIPGALNYELHQGPEDFQIYRKNNPDFVPPKVTK